jgi:hypothetical protein
MFASYAAEEAAEQVSLEEQRLRTPALAPVGCWSMGCARPRRPCRLHARTSAGYLKPVLRSPDRRACRACAGAATCPARARRACGCSCAPAAAPRATAQRRARRRPGARGTRARAGASERAPDRRGCLAGPMPKVAPVPLRAGSCSVRGGRLLCLRFVQENEVCVAVVRGGAARLAWRAGDCLVCDRGCSCASDAPGSAG